MRGYGLNHIQTRTHKRACTHIHTHTYIYICDARWNARPQPLVCLIIQGQMLSLRVLQVQKMYRYENNHCTFIQNYNYKKHYNCHYIVNALKSGELGLAV